MSGDGRRLEGHIHYNSCQSMSHATTNSSKRDLERDWSRTSVLPMPSGRWGTARREVVAFLSLLTIVRKRLLRSQSLAPILGIRIGTASSRHSQYLAKLRLGCKMTGALAGMVQKEAIKHADSLAAAVAKSGAVVLEVEAPAATATPFWQQGSLEMHTSAAIEKRLALRSHPAVREALHALWLAVLRSLQRERDDAPDDAHDDANWLSSSTLHFEGYSQLFTRVYRLLIETWDAEDVLRSIREDFEHDCKGQVYMRDVLCCMSWHAHAIACSCM